MLALTNSCGYNNQNLTIRCLLQYAKTLFVFRSKLETCEAVIAQASQATIKIDVFKHIKNGIS